MKPNLSAAAAAVERLVGEEHSLTAEIQQRQERLNRVRATLETVRLLAAGQQLLPIEGVEPHVPAPRPAKLRKLSRLQRAVLFAAAQAVDAPYQPGDREARRSATSLENAGLLEWSLKGETVQLTAAGRELYEEMRRREGATS